MQIVTYRQMSCSRSYYVLVDIWINGRLVQGCDALFRIKEDLLNKILKTIVIDDSTLNSLNFEINATPQ